MKKKIIVAVIVVLFIIASYLILTGFRERTDVYLIDFSVSESGDEITLSVGVSSSMGYIRGYKDEGGGVKPHYLKFYSTFGGLNSSLGAKNEFVLDVDENDTEIYFCRPDGGYEIVLVKADGTGEWLRPARGGTPFVVDEEPGNLKESDWQHGKIIAGSITPEFASMLLALPKPTDTDIYNKMTPFFNVFLDSGFSSSHYGTEIYI